ncbi:Gfo/Idh/MocA family protein [Halalkalibacter flavus]|uniref:Gfo/Idh/MocA family protein n=1 Tax=Halalkalibacter flavus TaxID=3090668 RepID=UPI002FCB157E
MKEVKIGVIGAGWMAKAHTMAFRNAVSVFGTEFGVPVFEVIADINEALAKQAKESLNYNRYTTDWKEVITDPTIDLIDISTPNSMHYEMAKAALEHGKNVFCEKPLSISGKQSRELADLAKEKGVVNYAGYSNVMNPANAYVEELIKTGALGQVMRVTATYDQDMLLDPDLPITWRHINRLAGSGALGDLGCHLLSVFHVLLGDIEKVSGMQSIVIPERAVSKGSKEKAVVENDDIIQFLCKYKNGAIGSIGSSRVATGRKNYFYYEIQGTQGSVIYDLQRMGEVQVYFKKDEGRDCGYRTVHLNPYHKGFSAFQPAGGIAIGFDDMKILQAKEILSAVTTGTDYACTFEMGAKVDSIVDAVLKSIETGEWEEV